MGNALAPESDEGRGKLRKASGSGTHTVIRRFPNGKTRRFQPAYESEYIAFDKHTRGSETSQYPQEKKSIEIPSVAASERGRA